MSYTRTRRAIVAVAAASSLAFAAVTVPGSPIGAYAAATTTNTTLTCDLLAAGGSPVEVRIDDMQLPTTFTVDGVTEAEPGQEFDLTFSMAPIVVQNADLGRFGAKAPVLPKANKVWIGLSGDVELVNPPAGVSMVDGGLLFDGKLVTAAPANDSISFAMPAVQLKFKAAAPTTLAVTTVARTMHAEGHIEGGFLSPDVGVRLLCDATAGTSLHSVEIAEAPTEAEETTPVVAPVKVEQGATVENAPAVTEIPDTATVAVTEGSEVPDWITVNEDGTVTAAPGEDVEPGDVEVPVTITYSDESTDTETITVTVTEKGSDDDEGDEGGDGPGGSDDGSIGSDLGDLDLSSGSDAAEGSGPLGWILGVVGAVGIGVGLWQLWEWYQKHVHHHHR